METDPATILKILIGASTFVFVGSVWLGAIVLWNWRRGLKGEHIKERLGLQSDGGSAKVLRLWRNGKSVETVVATDGVRDSFYLRLVRAHEAAGWSFSFPVYALMTLGLASLSAMLVLIFAQNTLIAIITPAIVIGGAYIVQQTRLAHRAAVFERQLVDSLQLAARSLRAGHPLAGALRLVSEEMPNPISGMFGEICQQHEMGIGLDKALKAAAIKSPSQDLSLFATSVALQIRSGGNLADMMEGLSNVIRDRERLSRRIRVLTAQTHFSKRVLIGMPIFVFIVLNSINPEYMTPLYTMSVGRIMLAMAVAGLAVGWWMMNRMANIQL